MLRVGRRNTTRSANYTPTPFSSYVNNTPLVLQGVAIDCEAVVHKWRKKGAETRAAIYALQKAFRPLMQEDGTKILDQMAGDVSVVMENVDSRQGFAVDGALGGKSVKRNPCLYKKGGSATTSIDDNAR